MVKIGTSGNQKRLFFNLRRMRNQVMGDTGQHLSEDNLAELAKEMRVSKDDVRLMDQRFRHGDESLNIAFQLPILGQSDMTLTQFYKAPPHCLGTFEMIRFDTQVYAHYYTTLSFALNIV